ncbi:hypothetical protein CC80DRAFT_531414 [Byssothecium circinans]|uniref:DUF676 domain-containing protein n=1 Tax=Byssothecium circinans TaxID=147558 RepID=A0A6A5UF67_9PLEO|nr:hypothetical protein CC80DRAFT_531414 [Byssothecium circinans]
MGITTIFGQGRKKLSTNPKETVATSSVGTASGATNNHTSPLKEPETHLDYKVPDATGPTIIWPENRTLFQDTQAYTLDVVFIHGLNGGSFRTWSKDGAFWPKQFLSKILPTTRIMTFGYNANLFSDCAQGRIIEFVQTLLAPSKIPKDPSRPILFSCHNMDGLVAKLCT